MKKKLMIALAVVLGSIGLAACGPSAVPDVPNHPGYGTMVQQCHDTLSNAIVATQGGRYSDPEYTSQQTIAIYDRCMASADKLLGNP